MMARPTEEQLTAYVMGELEAPAAAEVEAALRESAELRAEAEELRQLCALLWDELRSEPRTELGEERKAALVRQISGKGRASRPAWWHIAAPACLAVAAAVALVIRTHAPKLDVVGAVNTASRDAASEVRFVPAAPEAEVAVADKKVAPREKSEVASKPQAVAAAEPMKSAPMDLAQAGPVTGRASPKRKTSSSLQNIKGVAGAGGAYSMAKADKRRGPRVAMEEERADDGFNTEQYDSIKENPFYEPTKEPLSTFSLDVDTASYANVRRFIASGSLPPKDAVRLEELVNYFPYDYSAPTKDRPFSVSVEVADAPWAPTHRLVRVGLRAKDIAWQKTPPSNLVFLIDVSGSMNEPQKLPLVKESVKLLVDRLGEKDHVAIVVYAGNTGLVLPPTDGNRKQAIMDAIDRMEAGGSTNGGAGLQLAYKTARAGIIKGGVNRVILATDGDWNVGVTNNGDLVRLIKDEAKSGVFLSVLGFGMGNYKDATLAKLSGAGRGNYAYIDTLQEARKVLVEQIGGTLFTVAKDVKAQVEFNPKEVSAYRLLGYETRLLAHQEFNDDKKDAGAIGAGHTVTALYEVVPKGVAIAVPGTDKLKYQEPAPAAASSGDGELMTVKLRYKAPEAETSSLLEYAVKDPGGKIADASSDLRFAASVAEFGLLLHGSEYKGQASWGQVQSLASGALGEDAGGYRKEFLQLVGKARKIAGQ